MSTRDRMHVPRSRGAASGLALVLLGVWGGLVPFVGPYFDYAYTPDMAWHVTWGRFWLEILPAIAVVVGGLALLSTANRVTGWVGAWLAAAGGAWFVVGQTVSQLWNGGIPAAGEPAATSTLGQVAEEIGFFLGLGTVIVFFAATALGRMSVVGIKDLPYRGTETEHDERRSREGYDDRRGDHYDDDRVDNRYGDGGEHRATERLDDRAEERRSRGERY